MRFWQRALKHTSLYSIPVLASRLTSLVTLPIVTRYLVPADFAVVDLISTTFMVLELMVSNSFAEAMLVFHAAAVRSGDDARKKRVLQTALYGSLILGFVASAAGCLASSALSQWIFQTSKYSDYFTISFIGIFGSCIYTFATNYYRMEELPGQGVVLALSRLVLTTLVALAFLIRGFGAVSVLGASTIGVTICSLVVAVRLVRWLGFGFDWLLFRQTIRFALPLALSGVAMLYVHYGDRYYLQRHASLESIGVYSLAYRIGMILPLVHGPFYFFWKGHLLSMAADANRNVLNGRIFVYVTVLLTGSVVLLSGFSQLAVAVLAGPKYSYAAILAPWLLFAYLFRSMADQLRLLFNAKELPWDNVISTGTAAAAAAVFYGLLIPRYQITGAVMATILAFLAMLAVTVRRAQALENHDLRWRTVGLGIGLAVLVSALQAAFASASLIGSAAMGVAGLVFWAAAVWSLLLDSGERSSLSLALREITARMNRSLEAIVSR